jgi:hypothetical protein
MLRERRLQNGVRKPAAVGSYSTFNFKSTASSTTSSDVTVGFNIAPLNRQRAQQLLVRDVFEGLYTKASSVQGQTLLVGPFSSS